jgi:hypothetical protein
VNPSAVMATLTLVVGIPLNVYVTFRLLGLARSSPTLRVLRERTLVSVCVLLVVVVFGLIFWNNDTVPPVLGLDVTKIVTRLAVLVVAVVPALYWLWIYR